MQNAPCLQHQPPAQLLGLILRILFVFLPPTSFLPSNVGVTCSRGSTARDGLDESACDMQLWEAIGFRLSCDPNGLSVSCWHETRPATQGGKTTDPRNLGVEAACPDAKGGGNVSGKMESE